jgi:hypothetical protein
MSSLHTLLEGRRDNLIITYPEFFLDLLALLLLNPSCNISPKNLSNSSFRRGIVAERSVQGQALIHFVAIKGVGHGDKSPKGNQEDIPTKKLTAQNCPSFLLSSLFDYSDTKDEFEASNLCVDNTSSEYIIG